MFRYQTESELTKLDGMYVFYKGYGNATKFGKLEKDGKAFYLPFCGKVNAKTMLIKNPFDTIKQDENSRYLIIHSLVEHHIDRYKKRIDTGKSMIKDLQETANPIPNLDTIRRLEIKMNCWRTTVGEMYKLLRESKEY